MKRYQSTSRTKTDTVVGLLPEKKVRSPVAETRATSFNPQTFLAKVGQGKTTLKASKEQLISQGDSANAGFYVQAGRVKLTVFSHRGKKPWSGSWSRAASLVKAASSGNGNVWRSPPHIHDCAQ